MALIDLALRNSGDSGRYCRRMETYPNLTKLGCLPQNLTDISSPNHPWYCHSLAFRMATYPEVSDQLFSRWETWLTLAQQAEGWPNEYAHWSNANDHWAKKSDKFCHFLWLLQCFEYFSQLGLVVSFPASGTAMPDLFVRRPEQGGLYVECYFYSQWWHKEQLLEDLLLKVDPNISIKRVHNNVIDSSSNPFNSDGSFRKLISDLAVLLTPDKLFSLKAAAELSSPQVICKVGGFEFLLSGTGEYQPSPNAHGDPAFSWPVFLKEIIKAKQGENNLSNSRPKFVMVNAFGLDFQLGFAENNTLALHITVLPDDIDELWVSVCGIDASLCTNTRIRKILRSGYAGSGNCQHSSDA